MNTSETAKTFDDLNSSSVWNLDKNRQVLFGAIFVALLFGFFAIDHSPGASTHFRFDADFIDSENRTADRVEAVNLVTAPVRIVLGIVGLCFFMIPARDRVGWGGVITFVLLLYLGYMGCTFFWSINQKVTLHKIVVLACFGLAAGGLARQFSIGELIFLFVTVCISYIGIGLLTEIVLGNFTPHRSEYRFVGTCHPNTLAVYGTFCCLAAAVYFGRARVLDPWLITIFAIGFITLLATKSRTTLAGFIFALMTVRFLTFRPDYRVFASSLLVLAMITGGLFLALSRNSVRSGLAGSMAMGRTEDVSSLTGRLPLWEELLRSIGDRPFVGHGYLAFWEKEKIDYLSALLKWEIPHGHNMYLDVLLDGGYIGLALFLLIFVVSLYVTFRRVIVNYDRDVSIVFGLLVFALVHGFAESLFKLPTFLSFMLVTLLMRTALTDASVRQLVGPADPTDELQSEGVVV
jgi:O-antigen ligase